MDIGKSKGKEKNVYKIITFVLIAVFIFGAVLFGVNYYGNNAYNIGYQNGRLSAVNQVLNNVADKGYVQFEKDNQSLVLVEKNMVEKGQKQVVEQIFTNVQENGHVSITNEENQLVLVPYQEPENVDASNLNVEDINNTQI